MEQEYTPSLVKSIRVPWNKGKLVGAKPPLKPSHVWSIRTKLQIERKKRDLALFNLAIDSKLRGCDVVGVNGGAKGSQGGGEIWSHRGRRQVKHEGPLEGAFVLFVSSLAMRSGA